MPYKIESNRIEIDSNVSPVERLLTGMLGVWIIFMLMINPHGFLHNIFSEKGIPFLIKLPGIFAGTLISIGSVYLVYRSLARPKKEIVDWRNGEFKIHFGTYSLKMRGSNPDLDLFKRTYDFNQEEVETIKLVSFSGGNELCIDQGKKRLRIGTCLSEIEKENLLETIKEKVLSKK